MAVYRTGHESPASLHARPSAGFGQGQARALRALLAQTYGHGAVLDRATVAGWVWIVAHWPPVEQEQPAAPPRPRPQAVGGGGIEAEGEGVTTRCRR